MPVTVSYPGLYIEELPSSSRVITAAPTSITVFVGYVHPFQGECAQDPANFGKAYRIFSFDDYERIFGGLYRSSFIDSHVAYAVNQFFLNGGADAYVVGLKPRYVDRTVSNLPDEDIKAAEGTLSGIKFTAKQLTDVVKMTITITPAPGGPNNLADIFVAHGSDTEIFRGVKVAAGDPTTNTDKDFIHNRLKDARLVSVAPATGGQYPSSYSTGLRPLELAGMPAPTTLTSWTTFKAGHFTAVFDANSSLDKVDIFNILAVPGTSDAAVWASAIAFAERKRAFYILDPPPNVSADGAGGALTTIQTIMEGGTVPTGSPNGAFYYPHLKSNDPLTGNVISLPPSGFVAGIYARTDTKRGVWKAPAGLETSIINTTGVVEEGRMTDMRQGTLNPLGVNVIRSFPGVGTVIWGARTTVTNVQSFQQWRYVPVRRTALFIEQTLLRNLGWVVFEPNDEPLWSAIRLTVENFMLSLFRQAAFQGATPSEAFLVKCDKTTTTQTDIDNGIVNIVVGFRPLKPAEFVIIKIAQLAGQSQT
jgi:uncharacterized protein